MSLTTHQKIQNSPFKNIYWFARHLLNTDQFGALGRFKEKQLLCIVNVLENILIQNGMTDDEKLRVCKETLFKEITSLTKENTKTYNLTLNLAETLDKEIHELEDIIIFCITMKYVVAPTNQAISTVPSDDVDFCEKTATHILDSLGEEKAGVVIATWDNMGLKGCLDAERTIIVEAFTQLIDNLSSIDVINHDHLDDNLVLTAFIQEFERRVGQKRRRRGGISLETVVSFLFDYYKFSSTDAPTHFIQDLEVDKWFKCKGGWCIGISCKRTLRERWKQVSQADRGTLSRFKIKELWHIITYDKDLSDDKIVRLGGQGHVFYLMDNSETFQYCKNHIGMKDYVRPLSGIISDIKHNIK